MKRILFVLVLLCLKNALHAQYVYTIKADSVKITNTCDTAELIIENHTQTVPGFLFNKGRGRTEFRRAFQFNDTSVVIGGDTIHLGRGYKNFANADLTYDGDHLHNGAFHSMNLTDFSSIGFKSNTTDGTQTTQMTMDPYQGFNLVMNNATDPNSVTNNSMSMSDHQVFNWVGTTTPDLWQVSQLSYNYDGLIFSGNTMNLNTGYTSSAGLVVKRTDYDPQELNLSSMNGTMRIYSDNEARSGHVELNFNRGDSLVTFCNGSSLFQTSEGFRFFSNHASLGFKLPGLPVSTNSQDSVLVIDNDGHVKKQAQSSITPALSIITGDIVDITAQVDAVTKLPNLQSHAGHSVSLPPAASYAGKKIYIWNQNASVNVWTFSSSITLPDGSTSNAISNQSTIELLSDGNVWIKWK